ncbi:uncharacterized protein PAC_15141 [Phialocephala subalpina]|uniref:Uncharacterized protein n=1 Tax=Phialocephala subalpina TaxID=576137 RepID=A0A1L7XJL9_9HELO|nr:uncharacterized protein PAC_15141 [Phialocephala subalpina]
MSPPKPAPKTALESAISCEGEGRRMEMVVEEAGPMHSRKQPVWNAQRSTSNSETKEEPPTYREDGKSIGTSRRALNQSITEKANAAMNVQIKLLTDLTRHHWGNGTEADEGQPD